MDCCLSYNKPSVLVSLPTPVKTPISFSSLGFCKLRFTTSCFSGDRLRPVSLSVRRNRRQLTVVSSAEASSHCGFSSLNTPLEPKSPAGKFLSGVLQNDCPCFHVAVAEQLKELVAERDGSLARMNLSLGTSEACLHRKIAELKKRECQTAVEDVMYMLISHKFSEIRVHLVPSLFKCIYNSRLEILPSKDWELESIHSFEVLEMIRQHLTTVIGWRADSNVTDNWATTQITRLHLCRIYAASILYGYFLKSASLRHHLELTMSMGTHLPCSYVLKNTTCGRVSSVGSTSVGRISCKLSSYVMGFDPETLEMCAKPKSKEAMNLIERHSCALFGDEKTGLLERDEVILTSLASLKRFVLEAVAFGSFLWDSEEYVRTVYKLEEN